MYKLRKTAIFQELVPQGQTKSLTQEKRKRAELRSKQPKSPIVIWWESQNWKPGGHPTWHLGESLSGQNVLLTLSKKTPLCCSSSATSHFPLGSQQLMKARDEGSTSQPFPATLDLGRCQALLPPTDQSKAGARLRPEETQSPNHHTNFPRTIYAVS